MSALTALRCLALRTPTLPPATHTNCYILGPSDALVVVDPASPWEGEQQRLLEHLGAVGRVSAILLTHHHPDHVGGVVALREALAVPVLAHEQTAKRVPFAVDTLVGAGQSLGQWRLLHTPGHATGHLCLWRAESRQLIAGDMVAGQGTIVLEPPEGHLGDYLDSLARLEALDPAQVFPAHGPVQGPDVLARYQAHRQGRTEQIQQALARRAQSPLELVAQVYGESIPKAIYPLAARQVLCHLIWLEERGRAQREGERWSPGPRARRKAGRAGVREDIDGVMGQAVAELGRSMGGERAMSEGARKVLAGLGAVAGELFDVAADQAARRSRAARRVRGEE